MKACIVTVYNSMNSGSFWQARVLGLVLEKMGYEVVYLKRTGGSSSIITRCIRTLKYALRGMPGKSVSYMRSIARFSKCQKVFSVVEKNSEKKDISVYILGSDTIWNLDNKYFADHYRMYWGADLLGRNVFSYAASAANTSIHKVQRYPAIIQAINNWKYIGVRDLYTAEMIETLSGRKTDIVCDPCILLNRNEYETIIKNAKIKRPAGGYVLLYLFCKLTNEQATELTDFARAKNLRIINGTGTQAEKYIDEGVVNSPYDFLGYMLYADCVVTDTFHGTVFSINLERQFASLNRGKNKVNSFLHFTGFADRLVGKNDGVVDKLITPIDYRNRMKLVEEQRKQSLSFLQKALF